MTDKTQTDYKSAPVVAHMGQLDGLRAVAILLVIGFHAWFFLQFTMESQADFLAFSERIPWLAGFIRRGDIGVDVFFVLSGYLLSWQLFSAQLHKGRPDFKRFYARRIFRIYPLYLVALAIVSIGPGPRWAILGNLLAYNIWFDPFKVIIPWTWSLSVELEFYAIVPLLILLARNGRAVFAIVVALAALSILWSAWTLAAYPQLVENSLIDLEIADRRADLVLYYKHLYSAMPVRLGQFAVGLGAAWLVVYRPRFFHPTGLQVAGFAAVILIGFALPLAHNPHGAMNGAKQTVAALDMIFGRVGFALAMAAIIGLMQQGGLGTLKAALSRKWLEPIARFSFSMYLFHPAFVYLGILAFVGRDKVTSVSIFQYFGVFLVSVGGAMLFGAITWVLIERPAIRLGQRLF